jgi:hypothetical protein
MRDRLLKEVLKGPLLFGVEAGQCGVLNEKFEELLAQSAAICGEDEMFGAAVGGMGAALDEALLSQVCR